MYCNQSFLCSVAFLYAVAPDPSRTWFKLQIFPSYWTFLKTNRIFPLEGLFISLWQDCDWDFYSFFFSVLSFLKCQCIENGVQVTTTDLPVRKAHGAFILLNLLSKVTSHKQTNIEGFMKRIRLSYKTNPTPHLVMKKSPGLKPYHN